MEFLFHSDEADQEVRDHVVRAIVEIAIVCLFSAGIRDESGEFLSSLFLGGSDHAYPADEGGYVSVDSGDHIVHVGEEVFGCLCAGRMLGFGSLSGRGRSE